MAGAIRNRQLRALGIVPFQLRAATTVDEPLTPAVSDAFEVTTTSTETLLQLWLPPTEGDPFAGPHARLLGDVLRSLALSRQQVLLGMSRKGSDLPLLAFGPGAPAGAITLASLVKLRDPIEKRIAWKQLRQLRRRLREVSE